MDRLKPYLELMNKWGTAVVGQVGERRRKRGAAVGARIRYKTPAGPIEYAAQIRAHFRHEDPRWVIGQIHALGAPGRRVLLLAPYCTETQRRVLMEGDVDYVDLAGNVHLEKQGFLIHVEGKRERPEAATRPANVFRRAGLQVIYVLLARPDAVKWPYRPLAKRAGVALRTANYVLEGLRAEGFVAGRGERRRLLRRGDLIGRWVTAYRTELRPRLLKATYRTRPETRDKLLVKLKRYFAGRKVAWALTGAEAAYRLEHLYRDGRLVVYAQEELPDFEEVIGLARDPGGDLQLLRYFCDAIGQPVEGREFPLAHPLLVYAELLAEGTERAGEAAEAIGDRLRAENEDDD
jgi:hypothetical protein